MIELRCKACGIHYLVSRDELGQGPAIYALCLDCRDAEQATRRDHPPIQGAPRRRPAGPRSRPRSGFSDYSERPS